MEVQVEEQKINLGEWAGPNVGRLVDGELIHWYPNQTWLVSIVYYNYICYIIS